MKLTITAYVVGNDLRSVDLKEIAKRINRATGINVSQITAKETKERRRMRGFDNEDWESPTRTPYGESDDFDPGDWKDYGYGAGKGPDWSGL